MKKKNYKIRITKNKILKENEYDFTKDFGDMGKALVDSAKMAFQTARRMFNATVFAVKTLNDLRKGDLEAMDSRRRNFMIDDERMKQEQNNLIKAQPGTSDLNKFLAMTSPGALFFEKVIVDPNKRELIDKFKKTFGIDDDDDKKDRLSKASYHNLIMRIAEITHKAQVDLNTTESLQKKKLKKASKEVFNLTDTPKFKKAVAYIASFYTKTDYKIEDKMYFEVSDEFYKVLKMIHDDNNKHKKDIIQRIKDKDISYSLNSVVKYLKSGNARARFENNIEKFNYDGKNLEDPKTAAKKALEAAAAKEKQKIKQEEELKKQKEAQSKNENASYTLKINSNNIILKEEDEKRSEDIDFKEDMLKSFSIFNLLTLYIYVQDAKITAAKNTIFEDFNSKVLESLYKENSLNKKTLDTFKTSAKNIIDASDNLNKVIENYNKVASEYNSEFSTKSGISLEEISLLDNSKFDKTVKEINQKTIDSMSKLEEELKDDKDNESKRKLLSSSLMLEILDNYKNVSSINNTLDSSFNQLKKDTDSLINDIDADAVNKSRKEISSLNIPADFFGKIQEEIKSISDEIDLYKKASTQINNLTKVEQNIELEALKAQEESSGGNQDQSKDSNKEIDGKYTKTVITKKEDK